MTKIPGARGRLMLEQALILSLLSLHFYSLLFKRAPENPFWDLVASVKAFKKGKVFDLNLTTSDFLVS